ncbi:MAG: hypothetical protein JWP92_3736 [Caulobacter sp.]|nr:hypothetical protein [Caulobacter sp.]
MTSPTVELQKAGGAALLADAGVISIVAGTPDGPAVFAAGQDFDDVFPRVTFGAPQRVAIPSSCGVSANLFWTLHSWARGPDCTQVAAELADAVIVALTGLLLLAGWRVSSFGLVASRPVGDPEPTTEHFVTEMRFTVHQAA